MDTLAKNEKIFAILAPGIGYPYITMSLDKTVSDLKKAACEKLKISPDDFIFIFAGNPLRHSWELDTVYSPNDAGFTLFSNKNISNLAKTNFDSIPPDIQHLLSHKTQKEWDFLTVDARMDIIFDNKTIGSVIKNRPPLETPAPFKAIPRTTTPKNQASEEKPTPLKDLPLPETLLQYLSFEKKPLREAWAKKNSVSRIGSSEYWKVISEEEREQIWKEWEPTSQPVVVPAATTEEDLFVKKIWSDLSPQQKQCVNSFAGPGRFWGGLGDHEKRHIYKTWLAEQAPKPTVEAPAQPTANLQNAQLSQGPFAFFESNESNTSQNADANEDSWFFDVD